MLDVADVDLSALADALEDHSALGTWWFDPRAGQVLTDDQLEFEDRDPEVEGLISIHPVPSSEGYGDMEDFVGRVLDPRARDLLERAIHGRGAFRRFKDTLFEFPQLREAWFAFHDVRMERRALEWLAAQGLVDHDEAEREIAERADPPVTTSAGPLDGVAVAAMVARDLRELYGTRLKEVVLFGSWARGDARPESDVDLLVVLDRVDSPWEELRRMEPLLWSRSIENDLVVSATPVSEDEAQHGRRPVLLRARAEGRRVP